MIKQRRLRRAMALIAVLWISVLMMALVSVAAQTSLLDSRVSQIENEKQRGRWACRAGVETAIALLLEDDRAYDGLTDLWTDNPEELEELDFGGVMVTIEVIDAASKLNVNLVTAEQLAALPDMTEDVADSILDWADNDEEIRPGGAEIGYYLNLPYPYETRNATLQTIRELLRVKGVTQGLFYGDAESQPLSPDNEGWIHYLTCSSQEMNQDADGNARININRAGQQTLRQQLNLSESQARWITENRRFRNLGELTGKTDSSGQQNQSNRQGQSSSSTSQSQQSQASSQQTQGRQTQNQQSQGRQTQQQQPAAEPLDVATVLRIADQISLTNRRYLTGRVNVNTAGLEVLTALLGGNRDLAQNIIAAREGLGGVFMELGDLQQVEGMTQDVLKTLLDRITIRSSVFEIHVTAASQATKLRYQVEALVNRDAAEGQILYWREGIAR